MTLWLGGNAGLVLTESHSGNAATFTLKPSTDDDYPVSFFDGSEAVVPADGISLTIPSGATLDVLPPLAFRLWFAIFNKGDGTVSLAVRKCSHSVSGAISVNSPNEYLPLATTLCDTSADNPHVFYSASALPASAWMWVSFANYEASLTTAGAWASSPTSICVVKENTPRPGNILQQAANQAQASVVLTTSGQSSIMHSVVITPSSKANLIEGGINGGYVFVQTAAANGALQFKNANTGVVLIAGQHYDVNPQASLSAVSMHVYDIPNLATAITYQAVATSLNVNGTIQFLSYGLYAKEIMG